MLKSWESKLVFCETSGSIFWFFMDACWMIGDGSLVLILSVPAVLLNLAIFLYTPKQFTQILITAAMNFWLLMNLSWAVSDLYKLDLFLSIAKIFLVFGIFSLIATLIFSKSAKEAWQIALSRFKRLRIAR